MKLHHSHSHPHHEQSGEFKSQAASWISCSSTTQTIRRSPSDLSLSTSSDTLRDEILALLSRPQTTIRSNEVDQDQERGSKNSKRVFGNEPELACPLIWAQEANAFDCVRLRMCLISSCCTEAANSLSCSISKLVKIFALERTWRTPSRW